MASFGARQSLGGPSPASSTIPPPPASLPQRPVTAGAPVGGASLNLADMARQVAEAKRRAAASLVHKAVQDNPYLVSILRRSTVCV